MANKRDVIAATADRLFYHEGFEAVGIDRLVQEAPVALGTLYRHFKGRPEVVVAALQNRHAAFMAALEAAPRTPDPALALFDALGAWAEREGGNGCLFLRAAAAHPRDPAIIAAALEHKRAYLAIVTRRLIEGGHGAAEAGRLAPTLFLLLEGAVAAAFTLGDRFAVAQARSVAAGLLSAAGIGRRGGR